MEKKVIFEYNQERNIVFIDDNWEIKTKEDVDEFFDEYRKFFTNFDKKVYMVAHIDGLLVHAKIAEYYGEVARRTIGNNMIGFARWGTNDWARMTLRTTSLKAKMVANIYSTKEEATVAIEKLKEKKEAEIQKQVEKDENQTA